MPRLSLNKTSSRDQFFDIARGLRPDCTPVHLFGFNNDVGTSFETIWNDGGGIYSFPASAVQMSLVSSSASDTMQVMLTGLNGNRGALTEIVTLTGTTPVATTNSFFRINDARIISGSNVGNITISYSGTTHAYIEAGSGVHQAAIYSTPSDSSLYITSVHVGGTIGLLGTMTFRAKLQNESGYELVFWNNTTRTELDFNLKIPFKIPAGFDFSIEGHGSTGTNDVSIYINALLMQD